MLRQMDCATMLLCFLYPLFHVCWNFSIQAVQSNNISENSGMWFGTWENRIHNAVYAEKGCPFFTPSSVLAFCRLLQYLKVTCLRNFLYQYWLCFCTRSSLQWMHCISFVISHRESYKLPFALYLACLLYCPLWHQSYSPWHAALWIMIEQCQ